MNKMADYWELLSEEDRQFILGVLQHQDPDKYKNYHEAHLALIKFKTVKYAVIRSRLIPLAAWYDIPSFAYERKFKAVKRRVLQRLSPELLKQWQSRKWREQQKRRQQ